MFIKILSRTFFYQHKTFDNVHVVNRGLHHLNLSMEVHKKENDSNIRKKKEMLYFDTCDRFSHVKIFSLFLFKSILRVIALLLQLTV